MCIRAALISLVRLGLLNEMRRSVCMCAERIENECAELDIGSGGRERERLGGVWPF